MNNPWNQIKVPQKDANVRRIDHAHPLDLFWGKDFSGRYLFIFELSEETDVARKIIPEITGIEIELFKNPRKSLVKRIVCSLNDNSDWELFYILCMDIVKATNNVVSNKNAISLMIDRLFRWQEFFKKSKHVLLTEEEIRGLIGELLFLTKHLIPKFGIQQSIRYWQGPEGLAQDFYIDTTLIEVKTHLVSSSIIRINSSDQLCPKCGELFLYVVTLGKAEPDEKNTVTLPSIINQIRKNILEQCPNVLDIFNELLRFAGYFESDHYLDFTYSLSSEIMYQVFDSFPRICTDDLHPGIINLSYSINLIQCSAFEKYPAWMPT